MLIVLAEVRVAEEAVAAVRDAIATMEVESRKEPGCITYAFSVDVSDSSMVRISERWNSAADLEKQIIVGRYFWGATMTGLSRQNTSLHASPYRIPRYMPV